MVVERKGTQFRVVWQGGSVGWWEDTASNRKATVVFLRAIPMQRTHAKQILVRKVLDISPPIFHLFLLILYPVPYSTRRPHARIRTGYARTDR